MRLILIFILYIGTFNGQESKPTQVRIGGWIGPTIVSNNSSSPSILKEKINTLKDQEADRITQLEAPLPEEEPTLKVETIAQTLRRKYAEFRPKLRRKYTEYSPLITRSLNEPLVTNACISCSSCLLTAITSLSLCPEQSLCCHCMVGNIISWGVFLGLTYTEPSEDLETNVLFKTIKQDLSSLLTKNNKEKHD